MRRRGGAPGGNRARAAGRRALDREGLAGLIAGQVAREAAVLGPGAVMCLECGGIFRAIRAMHLTRVHDYDDVSPVAAYRARWHVGAEATTCKILRDRARSVQERRWTRAGHRWRRARILVELKSWARKDRRIGSAGRIPVPIVAAAKRQFGSWRRALRAAGLGEADVRARPRITRDELLDTLRRLHREGQPVSQRAILGTRPELKAAATREFGPGWSRALRAAGIDPTLVQERPGPTPSRARAWVRTAAAAGAPLGVRDVPKGLSRVVRRELGISWNRFLRTQGLPARTRRTWTRATVVTALRARVEAGRPMRAGRVAREDPGLAHAARRRFGCWDAALRAIGADPDTVRGAHRWTREALRSGLRRRLAAGKPLDATSVHREDRLLYRIATERLHWTWPKALAFAGIDPSPHRRSNRLWTAETAAAWIRERAKSRRPLAARDVPAGLYAFVHRELRRPWPAFVRAHGGQDALGFEQVSWTRDEVVRRLRRRGRAGAGLHAAAVQADEARLYTWGARLFGSWPAALAAAGFDPESIVRR